MELWHHAYKAAHPDIETLAVDEPPWWLRAVPFHWPSFIHRRTTL